MVALSIPDILMESEERLSGVDSPRLSAELLAAHVLGCTRLSLVIDRHRVLNMDETKQIRELVARRAAGEPLAYIVGVKEFYGLDFSVTPDTLIPRPETEHIVEAVEVLYSKDETFHFVDLGTGSGILAVTIASLFPASTGIAVDMSPGAIAVAKNNAKMHGVDDRIVFQQGDFTTRLFDDEAFDLVVSNPPYVTAREYDEASHEVTAYEPETALVSGDDGLDHIRDMLPLVSRMLKVGGRFLVEIGWKQGRPVVQLIESLYPEFKGVCIIKDLAGHDRIVKMQKL